MRKLWLLMFIVMLSGCSMLPSSNTTSQQVLTLQPCLMNSCEAHFVIKATEEENWVEQLVFESQEPLIDSNILKNSAIKERNPLGIGYNSEHPNLVLIPVGIKLTKERLGLTIYHASPKILTLQLKHPLNIVIESIP